MKETAKQSPQLYPHRSLLWRIAAYMLSVSVLTVATLSITSFLIARSYVEQGIFAQLSSLVAAKEDLIEGQLQRNREHTMLLASRQDILQMVEAEKMSDLRPLFLSLVDEGLPIVGMTLFTANKTPLGHVGTPTETLPVMSARTAIIPHLGEEGWKGHIVFAGMQGEEGVSRGYLAVRYSEAELLERVLSADILGTSAEVLLGRVQGDELELFQHKHTGQFKKPLYLDSVEDQYVYGDALALALKREEGVHKAEDYAGERVFASYRYLPTFGWALVVKVDRTQALSGIFALGATMIVISILLLLLAGFLSVILSRDVTEPLRKLIRRVSKLGPGHWGYRKFAHTGDEVEVLDRTTADLAKRLKRVYDNLEEEIKEQTEALKVEYEKDHTILESIEHGIIVVDKKGIVTDHNAAAVEIIGCHPEESIGMKVTEIIHLHGHKRPVPDKNHPVLRCLRRKKTIRSVPEMPWSLHQLKEDVLIPVLLSVTPILEGKKVLGAIAVFRDITEERRIDYLKSEFISLASHQLRTPLSTMHWYIEFFTGADAKNLTDEQKEYVKEMDIATVRMAKLVDALLHAVRLEGQTMKAHTNHIDLRAFMNDMAEELRPLAKESKIACDIHIPDKACSITTDPILLHIVFQNLFSNAVKYTEAGGQIELTLRTKGGKCEISVSDNGVGIPKKDKKRIFERLFRADNVRKMDTDGNGLGLYISHMIMDTLGGSIRFTSDEKTGSTFTITLPRKSKKH